MQIATLVRREASRGTSPGVRAFSRGSRHRVCSSPADPATIFELPPRTFAPSEHVVASTQGWPMEERSPARSPVSFASGYADAPAPLLVCFSHLRWDFVWQRPQHLLSRAAKHYRVLQIEEPLFEKGARPRMDVSKRPGGIAIATPVLPEGLSERDVTAWQRRLIDRLLAREPEIAAHPLVLHADGDGVHAPSRMRSVRLRQHGRALAFPRRLAGDDRQRGRAVPARRRRLHRRHEPIRGEAEPAPQRARLPVLDRLRPFREGAAHAAIPSPPTRRRSRIRGSASSASSTSAWTSISSPASPI